MEGAAAIHRRSDLVPLVEEASRRFRIPANWIWDVIRVESGSMAFRVVKIRSSSGAMGPMQIMPGTWQMLTRSYRLGRNPDAPEANILAGAAYLRILYNRFGYPGLFAAYNGGPYRYEAYLSGRTTLPLETVRYQLRIVGVPGVEGRLIDQRRVPQLFVALGGSACRCQSTP